MPDITDPQEKMLERLKARKRIVLINGVAFWVGSRCNLDTLHELWSHGLAIYDSTVKHAWIYTAAEKE